jgi:histone H3/H4
LAAAEEVAGVAVAALAAVAALVAEAVAASAVEVRQEDGKKTVIGSDLPVINCLFS